MTLCSLHRLGCGSLDYRELAQQVELSGWPGCRPQVLPRRLHLNAHHEQVTISSGAGWWGLVFPCIFFSFSEGQNSFFPPGLGCAVLLLLPR